MKQRRHYLIGSIVLACALMAVVEVWLQPGYAVKSAVKIALFAGAAAGYQRRFPGELGRLFQFKNPAPALGLGAAIFCGILGAFWLLRDYLDLQTIAASLLGKEGVSRENFLLVALYISIFNSGLEELLFRGLGYLLLRDAAGERFAGVFSAGMFALYHVGILKGWMNWWLYALCLLGLFVGGLLFNALDGKGSLLPSWLAHGAANLAINTIGLLMFGLISY